MLKVKFVDLPNCNLREVTLEILRRRFGEVVESEEPEFLFYSTFGHEHLKYNCVRICWLGENLQPDFNVCDYAIGFSYMTFEDRYIRVPLYYFYLEDYAKARNKHIIAEKEFMNKTKFCNFVYSNDKAIPEREEFFELLSEYKTVDSGGKFRNNIGGPIEDKNKFQKDYKFSIAFENSSTSGYTTEKILQAFSACTIPIYFGNPKVAQDFNERAFINCHNYNDFDEVVQLIERIDKDETLFRQYLLEPIGTEQQFPVNGLQEYENFIVRICAQSPHEALRRNNVFWGKWYQQDLKSLRFPPQYTKKEVCYLWIKKQYSCIRKFSKQLFGRK